MVQYKVAGGSGSRRVSVETELDFAGGVWPAKAGSSKVKAAWDGKEATHEDSWTHENGRFTYESTITTPYEVPLRLPVVIYISSQFG